MYIVYKHMFIFLCFFVFTTTSNCQNTKIDSLKNELKIHKERDTTRVNLLNELAFSSFSSDIPKTLEYIVEADKIASAIHYNKGKARSIYIKGITEAVESNYNQALGYYNESLKLYEGIDFKKGIANCYNAIGIVYKNTGKQKESILYLKKAIKIEEEIGGENLSAALINLGALYSDLGEFNEAIFSLKKALSIARINKNQQRIAYSLNNLGTVYLEQGNYPLALLNIKESIHINEKIGDSMGIYNNLFNTGKIYKAQKNFDLAINYYKKALKIVQLSNTKKGISNMLNAIGTIHEENKEYNYALEYYFKALVISKQIDLKSEIPFILNNIGGVYLVLNNVKMANHYFIEAKKSGIEIESKSALCGTYIGLARTYINQKKYKSALEYAFDAQEISKNAKFLVYQKEASEILFNIYNAIGKYKEALKSYQQFKVLSDSLLNEENIKKITEIEYEYKYKKELEDAGERETKLTKTVETTSKDLEKSQRNLLLGIITFLAIAMVLGSVIFFLKLRNSKAKTENIITEQKLLRSQMTPHFIFNSLSVLQGMILNNEESKSVNYLTKFSKLLRIILENSRDKSVLLSQELEAVENYLSLQNIENEKIDFKLAVDNDIETNTIKVPPMLIQPFVENAIEHAFKNQKENYNIEINLTLVDSKLICIILDNGIGIDSSERNQNATKKSLGTKITSERLQYLSKDFKMEGSVTIEDRSKFNEHGTKVTIQIPFLKQETL